MAWLHLAPVVDLLKTFDVSTLSGFDELDPLQQDQVRSQLSPGGSIGGTSSLEGSSDESLAASDVEVATVQPSGLQQPELGVKTKTKGRAAWKFAGQLFYGELLSSQETLTHCYARTHKGKTKTLAKGKEYWHLVTQ